jgi:hypothetical protein
MVEVEAKFKVAFDETFESEYDYFLSVLGDRCLAIDLIADRKPYYRVLAYDLTDKDKAEILDEYVAVISDARRGLDQDGPVVSAIAEWVYNKFGVEW